MFQASLFGIDPAIVDGKEVFALQGMKLLGVDRSLSSHATLAEIQLKQHTDGRWMWATNCYGREAGSGYSVMEKWGNFEESRESALARGVKELAKRIKILKEDEQVKVLNWLEAL